MTDEKSPQGSGARLVVRILLGVLGVLLLGYGVLFAIAGDGVPRGTTVEGVRIGGLGPAAAEERLRKVLGPRSEVPIVLTRDGKRATTTPAEAGLAVDYEATVADAGGGRSLLPGRLWDYYTGGEDVQAELDVDGTAMDAAVATVIRTFEVPAVEGRVRFVGGKARPTYSNPGVTVDEEDARTALEEQFLHPGSTEVPVESVDPEIGDDAVDRALRGFARPAMSGPVTLTIGSERIVAPPRLLGKGLAMVPRNGELEPSVRVRRLVAALQPVMEGIGPQPADATFRIVDGIPELVPAEVGATLDPADLKRKLPRVLVRSGERREITVKARVVQPELTTAEARKLGIKEQVSTFTTFFPYAEYRNVNLSRAASLIDGTVLEPGETFSLNGIVGERTKENGFTEGFIIKDGLFRLELGGGVSQIATTTFNAMYFAGLEDVQHKPHSVYISRYPEGREATVAWPSLDLQFRNDTPHGIFITSSVEKAPPGGTGSATVSMYSTEHWDISSRKGERYAFTEPPTRYLDAPDCEASDGGPGFSVDVFRTFRRAGSDEVERVEEFKTVYNPEPRLICGKKPPA